MHPECYEWVRRWAPDDAGSVLDVGGRNVNGTPADLFPDGAVWEVVDLLPGDNVTWTGDFLRFCPDRLFDVALHLEVAEHSPDWQRHLRHARDCLAPDGVFIFTAAGPEREPHSALDGGPLRPGEHYSNVQPDELATLLVELFGWSFVNTTDDGRDVRAVAKR